MTTSERHVLASLYPYDLVGVTEEELCEILDRWFAETHYDDNPVYTWNDNESIHR